MINILNSICTDAAGYKIFGFVGVLLTIIKIIVPIIIVIMGSIDLVKAVMAQKDDEIKKGYSTLIKRLIIGVVIFFVPGIVGLIIDLAGGTQNCESSECAFKDSSACISKSEEIKTKQSQEKEDELLNYCKSKSETDCNKDGKCIFTNVPIQNKDMCLPLLKEGK